MTIPSYLLSISTSPEMRSLANLCAAPVLLQMSSVLHNMVAFMIRDQALDHLRLSKLEVEGILRYVAATAGKRVQISIPS